MEKLMAGWLNPYANATCLETFLQFYRLNVRFGSKADICAAISHVRFTPNSDRESGLPAKVLSPESGHVGTLDLGPLSYC